MYTSQSLARNVALRATTLHSGCGRGYYYKNDDISFFDMSQYAYNVSKIHLFSTIAFCWNGFNFLRGDHQPMSFSDKVRRTFPLRVKREAGEWGLEQAYSMRGLWWFKTPYIDLVPCGYVQTCYRVFRLQSRDYSAQDFEAQLMLQEKNALKRRVHLPTDDFDFQYLSLVLDSLQYAVEVAVTIFVIFLFWTRFEMVCLFHSLLYNREGVICMRIPKRALIRNPEDRNKAC